MKKTVFDLKELTLEEEEEKFQEDDRQENVNHQEQQGESPPQSTSCSAADTEEGGSVNDVITPESPIKQKKVVAETNSNNINGHRVVGVEKLRADVSSQLFRFIAIKGILIL